MAKKNIQFIKDLIDELEEQSFIGHQLIPPDIICNCLGQFVPPSPEEERAAQLADKYSLDITPFQGYRQEDNKADALEETLRRISRQLRVLNHLLVKLQTPPEPELIGIQEVAAIMGWKDTKTREQDKKGFLPKPAFTTGSIQWVKQDIYDWINAGCPDRQQWENIKTRRGVA